MAIALKSSRQLFTTKNDLPEDIRLEVVDLLNARLCDAIDLKLQAKQAHWNVKGPHFIALHKLFDELSTVLEEAIDSLAERAVQLGGRAEGTVQVVARRTGLEEYPLSIVESPDHIEALSNAIAIFGTNLRQSILAAEEDADSADLFTEISREMDKYLWFVEAHQQANS